MKVNLVRLDEATPSSGFQLQSYPLIAGRSDQADWSLDDRWVSRLHCRFEIENERLTVTDLSSKHGTFVNGIRVEKAALAVGDRLAIGLCTFVVMTDIAETADSLDADSAALHV